MVWKAGKYRKANKQTVIYAVAHFLFYAHRLCINYLSLCFYWLLYEQTIYITTFCILPSFVRGQPPRETKKHGKSTLPGFPTISSLIYCTIKKRYLQNLFSLFSTYF